VPSLLLLFLLTQSPDLEPGWKPAGRDATCDSRWFTRARPGVEVHELLATGLVDAPLDAVFAALLDFDDYQRTMPATAASKTLERTDGAAWVYLRYELSVIAPRESVVRMSWRRDATSASLAWSVDTSRDQLAPSAPGAVRVATNEGSWRLEPRDGKTFVTYRLLSAPGGSVPVFLVNSINGVGVPKTFAALERAARSVPPEQREKAR
jgi:hypothetical protein